MAWLEHVISAAATPDRFNRAASRRRGILLALASSALMLPAVSGWAQEAPAPHLQASPEFAQFPRYVGILGSRKIELLLGPKSDDPSGLHGEYHVLDTGEVVLVAGDRDGDTLALEESDDGTHITGQWVGQFSNNGGLTGDRMNDDETETQPYTLHLERNAPAN